jgi:2Fe-2S ferredoxin
MTFKCTLWPSGEVIEVDGERSLLEQLKKSGKKIKSSCGGCATCGDCVIIVKSGELNLNPQPFEETRLLGNVFHITKERLSCQTKVSGDVTIDISAHEKNSNSSKKTTGPVSKGSQVLVRKREEIEKSVRLSEEKSQEKPADTWYKHWEKGDSDPNAPKRLGGNKRVKPFRFADKDEDDSQ